MSEEKTEFWETKYWYGNGTLRKYVQECEQINSVNGQFIVGHHSPILTGNQPVDDSSGMYKIGIYEWVIVYKSNPNVNKSLNSDGKIIEKPQLSLE